MNVQSFALKIMRRIFPSERERVPESEGQRSSSTQNLREGFTLTELLIVIAIIMVLASLMGPTLNYAIRGTALTQGADKVIGVLSLARQTALTKAQTVEVRLYSFTNAETPGDSGQGHSLQAFTLADDGSYSPIIKAQMLPQTVIMTTATNLSTLMSLTNTTGSNTVMSSIPRAGTNYSYSSFQFYRSGMTSLPSSSSSNTVWCITVVNAADMLGANSNNLPKNYTTVVVDPYNGSLRTFRPTL
jgi:uncharacterized protein (TIGR02596 family)